MSCNGVAVARGTVAVELAELLQGSEKAVRDGIIAYLKSAFPHLGETVVKSLYWCGLGSKVPGITLQLGGKYNISFDGKTGNIIVKH